MPAFTQQQQLPISLEEAWAYFTNPANLNSITPESLSFEIKTSLPEKIYEGLLIEYRIKPMLRIPVKWVTKITKVQEGYCFADEQITGPYKTWKHEHFFEANEAGVFMTDRLFYEVGKGLLGKIAARLFVDRKVLEIFEYRKKKLSQIFN